MPIGADLVLHEEPDPEVTRADAARLARVVEETARRYRTPLAFPLMDLTLEKSDLLEFFGVSNLEADHFHFRQPPSEESVHAYREAAPPFNHRVQAQQGAIRLIAECPDLHPIGMLIGPFSLMTKLVEDPIAAVAMAGRGVTADEEPLVALVERCIELAEAAVQRSARAQIAAGARAMIVCEPAANAVYLSPRQIRDGSPVFENFVLAPNRRLRALFEECGVDLIFHNCGELTTDMVRLFAEQLRPAVLSLGSSRKLWEDAVVVPKSIVLFGNLPTKTFYSDSVMPLEEVRRLSDELAARMKDCGHPHILGSECDVLHVPEAADTIRRKVAEMLSVTPTAR